MTSKTSLIHFSGPTNIGVHHVSQHMHRSANGFPFIRGVLTRMLGQIILNFEIGYLAELTMIKNRDLDQGSFEVCYNCPAGLLPFRTRLNPPMTCLDHFPNQANFIQSEPEPLQTCPEWCLLETPITRLLTVSGFVDLRRCGIHQSANVRS